MWLAPLKLHLGSGAAVPIGVGTDGPGEQPTAEALAAAAAAAGALPAQLQQHNVLGVRLAVAVLAGVGAPAGGGDGPASPEAVVAVAGLRVWNYNKSLSLQDTARGVKRMLVLADGVEVSPPGGLLLRRGPGAAEFEFGQELPLCPPLRGARTAAGAGAGRSSTRRDTTPWGSSGRRSTMAGQQQLSARGSPVPARPAGPVVPGPKARQPQQQQQQQQAQQQQQVQAQQVKLWDESTAWLCNLPDPPAAAAFLQRCAAWRRSGALLAAQTADWFACPLPCGLSLKLVLLSSWGDPRYIGMCGVEVVDAVLGPLALRPSQVHAGEPWGPWPLAGWLLGCWCCLGRGARSGCQGPAMTTPDTHLIPPPACLQCHPAWPASQAWRLTSAPRTNW